MRLSEYTRHYKPIVRLGVPIIIGQLGTIVMGFADTLMIGRYGTDEMASASFVNTLFSLVLVFGMGFSYSLTPMIGRMFGENNHSRIGEILKNGVLLNILVSILIVGLMLVVYSNVERLGQPSQLLHLIRPYMLISILGLPFQQIFNVFKQLFDGITDTRTPMWIILLGNAVNVVGNWVLIYGYCGFPELGLLGAGYATLFSRILVAVLLVLCFFTRRSALPYRSGYVAGKINHADFFRINRKSWPIALQMGMEAGAWSLSTIIVGWLGVTALASHQVVLVVSQLFFMTYYGLAAAVAVRISYFDGRKDLSSSESTAMAGLHIVLMLALVISLPVMAFRHVVGYAFTDDAAVVALAAQTILPLVVYQIGDGLQCIYANALRGISYVRPMMYIAFLAYFVLCLPSAYLFAVKLGGGLVGLWYSYSIGLYVAGILYYIFFKRRMKHIKELNARK